MWDVFCGVYVTSALVGFLSMKPSTVCMPLRDTMTSSHVLIYYTMVQAPFT